MAIILGIETSSAVCSVALTSEGTLLSLRESTGVNEHSALLTAFISEVATEAGIELSDIDAVAVSMGPGSYTGLRIGVSTAKGLCYALDKRLIAVDTLAAIAWQMKKSLPDGVFNDKTVLCPLIDARRMEVYTASFNQYLTVIKPVDAVIVDSGTIFAEPDQKVFLAGDGAEKCKPLFGSRESIHFIDNVHASAVAVCELAQKDFDKSNFADTAYCEPFYFKDFVPGKPRVKGLN